MSERPPKNSFQSCASCVGVCVFLPLAAFMVWFAWTMIFKSENESSSPVDSPHAQSETASNDIRESLPYRQGFADGSLVGRTDAVEGRERDGAKAIRLGRIHAETYEGESDRKAYAKGYHEGYNEGWHQRKAAPWPDE